MDSDQNHNKMNKSKWLKIFIGIVVFVFFGFLSGIFTADEISGWYSTLNKPSFNPPNWIFAPVWTLLYSLMGIVFGTAWYQEDFRGMKLMGAQFLVNLTWTPVFFGAHELLGALFIILILLFMIGWCISHSFTQNKKAAYMLMPYFGWVSFATILNATIYFIN